jgi:hypothetical protein
MTDDDLHQAIQAATTALCDQHPAIGLADPWAQVARIAIEAAMPVLLQATRDWLVDLDLDLDLAEWKRAANEAAKVPVGSDCRVVRATPEDVLALVAEVERLRALLDDQDRCQNCGVTRKGATHRTVSIGVCEITLDQAAPREDDR